MIPFRKKPALRDNFVFRLRMNKYYSLKTIPTAARWSVAVGQSTTYIIVDIANPVTLHTHVDNILVAASEGQEEVFLRIVQRIQGVNLMTSPVRDGLPKFDGETLLKTAQKRNVFVDEEYAQGMGKSG